MHTTCVDSQAWSHARVYTVYCIISTVYNALYIRMYHTVHMHTVYIVQCISVENTIVSKCSGKRTDRDACIACMRCTLGSHLIMKIPEISRVHYSIWNDSSRTHPGLLSNDNGGSDARYDMVSNLYIILWKTNTAGLWYRTRSSGSWMHGRIWNALFIHNFLKLASRRVPNPTKNQTATPIVLHTLSFRVH